MKEYIKEKEWVCPKCGSINLKYGDSDIDGEALYYEFTCEDCKAEGKEWYNLEYVESIVEED